jgi:hypothetical protein
LKHSFLGSSFRSLFVKNDKGEKSCVCVLEQRRSMVVDVVRRENAAK